MNVFKPLLAGGIGLLVLAALVLVGGSVVDQYGYTLRDETTVNASTTTLATLLINTSVRAGTAGTYPYLQELTGCVNSTNGAALATANYNVKEGDSDGGYIYLTAANWNNTGVNCSNIVYLADTTGSDTADLYLTGLELFGTFSAILIIGLIGVTIISIFKRKD